MQTSAQPPAASHREQPAANGAAPNVDPAEIERFGAMAAKWWDPDGVFRPLHRLAPARLGFVREVVTAALLLPDRGLKPLSGVRLIDIGCGGGLVAEPLARLGATVTGIDLATDSIAAAKAHAAEAGVPVDYRAQSIEDVAAAGERFDVALCLEVLEHVPDPAAFLATAARVVEPGGVLIASTINRTSKAWLLAIVGAEYVLGWLPRGTHQWDKFVTPNELEAAMARAGMRTTAETGVIYNILADSWQLSRDMDVNYMLVADKPA